MGLSVTPLSPAIGAEIRGVDLSQELSAAEVGIIREAWKNYLVLLFRNQDLSEDDQVRFTKYFGPLKTRNRPASERNEAGRTKYEETMLVSNIREDGKLIGSLPDGEMQFHSDGCYSEIPLGNTFLYAIQIPRQGGDTLFLNMCDAYDTLPSALKARVEGRLAVNAYHYGTTLRDENEDYTKLPHYAHPVVRLHPESGRKALYVSRLMTRHIEAMPKTESDELLHALFDHIEQPKFVYAHKWTPGDLVVWDNSRTLHARTDFSDSERRLLRRTCTAGERVVGAPYPANAV